MASEIKLMPCPFCGQDSAMFVYNNNFGAGKTAAAVLCSNDDCGVSTPWQSHSRISGRRDDSEERAAKVWNRRARDE